MAVESQSWEAFANNDVTLSWAKITDSEANDPTDAKDLTGRIVKFSLARISGGEPIRANPLLDFASDDVGAQVTIPNPDGSVAPHVQVAILAADTIDLAPKVTEYNVQLEVFESDETIPVIVATGTLKIKPNVDNE